MTDLELFYAHQLQIDLTNAEKEDLIKLDEMIDRNFSGGLTVHEFISRIETINEHIYLHNIYTGTESLGWSSNPMVSGDIPIISVHDFVNQFEIEEDDWENVYD